MVKSIAVDLGKNSQYIKAIESINSMQNLATVMASSNIYSAHLKAMENISSAHKLSMLIANSQVQNAHAKVMDNIGSAHKLAEFLANSSVQSAHLKVTDSISSVQKLAMSITEQIINSAHLKALESDGWIQNVTKSLLENNTYGRYLEAMVGHRSIEEAAKSIRTGGAYETYLKSVSSSAKLLESIERLKQPEYLNILLRGLERDISSLDSASDSMAALGESREIDELFTELASTDSPSSFSSFLDRSPVWLKWFFLHVLLCLAGQLLIGAASGVIGNLITPYVEAYLQGAQASTQREKVKEIKRLSFSELGIELRDYRFISATTLSVREKPNSKSAVVGELRFGQVIGVLSTERDWTEVVYQYGDGDTLTGWVFTRYIAKFRS